MHADLVERFGGEEVATSDQLELVESATTRLEALASDLQMLIGPLPEPVEDPSFRQQLERAVELEAGR